MLLPYVSRDTIETYIGYHKQLEQVLGKGSVENYNGQARKYIKKSSDISQYDDDCIAFIEAKLNQSYMLPDATRSLTGASNGTNCPASEPDGALGASCLRAASRLS